YPEFVMPDLMMPITTSNQYMSDADEDSLVAHVTVIEAKQASPAIEEQHPEAYPSPPAEFGEILEICKDLEKENDPAVIDSDLQFAEKIFKNLQTAAVATRKFHMPSDYDNFLKVLAATLYETEAAEAVAHAWNMMGNPDKAAEYARFARDA